MQDKRAFAVWVTGLPASGKSTVVAALVAELERRGVRAVVLESDVLRPILTPGAEYLADREFFYRALADLASVIVSQGVPVILDATANRRVYRERARRAIPRFAEVFLDAPLTLCVERDPKGIYRKAREGEASSVPGAQEAYEPPLAPELTVLAGEAPDAAAHRTVEMLHSKGFLAARAF